MGCKSSTCIDSSKENNDRYPKFKIGDIVRISKRKNIFAKVTLQIDVKTFWWLKWLKSLKYGAVSICC